MGKLQGHFLNTHFFTTALAIYIRSPAAYETSKRFNIPKHPAKSTLHFHTGSFIHEPGASTTCIAEQYLIYKECCKLGKQELKADGAIIFNEVKVVCQLVWNSHSHNIRR